MIGVATVNNNIRTQLHINDYIAKHNIIRHILGLINKLCNWYILLSLLESPCSV